MFQSVKEKSWSVRLLNGYVVDDEVRSDKCENCKSKTEILVSNYTNPNLLLYGCKDNKCKHRFLRIDLSKELPTNLLLQEENQTDLAQEILLKVLATTITP